MFPSGSNTTIRIQVSQMESYSESERDKIFTLAYDVATARYWDGNVTERVEFNVYGIPPIEYSNYSTLTPERKCAVTHYSNYISYLWQWDNEYIIEDMVYVKFRFKAGIPFTITYWGGVQIGAIFLVFAAFLKLTRKRKVSK
jgi:hypothetical protein